MNYKNINDYELVYLIKEDDEEYKNILYNKYQKYLKNKCNYYCQKYQIDYEELFGELLIIFSIALKNYNQNKNSSFYTYLNVCVNNYINSYIKKIFNNKQIAMYKSISLSSPVSNDSMLEDYLTTGNMTELMMLENNYNNKLIEFKNELSIIESMIFELKYNGFKYKDISKLLDIELEVVKYSVKSINKKLKKLHSYL